MPIQTVRDPADPRLAPFADLAGRERDAEGIVVEGEIAVARALEGHHPVSALLLTPAHRARLGARIPATLPVYEAEAALLREVVGFRFHRGCVAVMPRPRSPSLARALGQEARLVVVAEGLADPLNLGALVRNARAFGADLVLHGGGADPWSRRAIRAAMGLGFSLPVAHAPALAEAVLEARARLGPGARTVAAVLGDDAVPLSRYRPAAATVLLVGNEGAGLSASLRALADDRVTIPLAPGVDSLNAAAATAVLLWALHGRGAPDRGPSPG
ncbi:MAG: RNA methyltransferase [Myxococcales bacterium]|nr:RNA methyltransferase [Myxococcales bacterium]MCB9719030.1 RNA methyltransferase [Myxococcales bacterium]